MTYTNLMLAVISLVSGTPKLQCRRNFRPMVEQLPERLAPAVTGSSVLQTLRDGGPIPWSELSDQAKFVVYTPVGNQVFSIKSWSAEIEGGNLRYGQEVLVDTDVNRPGREEITSTLAFSYGNDLLEGIQKIRQTWDSSQVLLTSSTREYRSTHVKTSTEIVDDTQSHDWVAIYPPEGGVPSVTESTSVTHKVTPVVVDTIVSASPVLLSMQVETVPAPSLSVPATPTTPVVVTAAAAPVPAMFPTARPWADIIRELSTNPALQNLQLPVYKTQLPEQAVVPSGATTNPMPAGQVDIHWWATYSGGSQDADDLPADLATPI